MLPDPKVKCPATGFRRSCRAVISKCDCPKFVQVKFRDPQTGELIDKHGCVDSYLLLATIEAAHMSAQTGAAIESFRNEVLKANEASLAERQQALAGLMEAGGIPRLAAERGR